MSANTNDLPKRHRFSWDTRLVPWTDGKCNQEDYVNAVRSWSAFHDMLPDTNTNKIPKKLRGIMLHSHLYGLAKDFCQEIPFDQIATEDGCDKICKALHKRDALSVFSTVYGDFLNLLSMKRGPNEAFRSFESRFAAAISKFKSHSASTMPESLTAFMLLANSAIESNQRISILAAATTLSIRFHEDLSNSDLLSTIKYYSIASVLRQCDKGEKNGTIHSDSANTSWRNIRSHNTLHSNWLKSKLVLHVGDAKIMAIGILIRMWMAFEARY